MSDEPIELDATGMNYGISVIEPIGCHDVITGNGTVHFCEGQGVITSSITKAGKAETVAVMAYIDGNETMRGKGVMVQLDPDAAREITASILRLADEIKPLVAN